MTRSTPVPSSAAARSITAPAPPSAGAEPKRRKPPKSGLTLWPEVREHQITMLDAVCGRTIDEAYNDWDRLLKQMRLELWHYIAAKLVIDAGAWREKNCPYGYVAAITRRKAKRLRLADVETRELQLLCVGERNTDDSMDYHGLGIRLTKNGVWKAGAPTDDPFESSPLSHVTPAWVRPNGDPGFDVDWTRVGQVAGLDEVETNVLFLRSIGLSRTDVLDTCDDDAERLEYQAGWRRLSRKMPNVAEVLRSTVKNFVDHVPDFLKQGTKY